MAKTITDAHNRSAVPLLYVPRGASAPPKLKSASCGPVHRFTWRETPLRIQCYLLDRVLISHI